ncbi:hypothetical protein HK405_009742, partial [Cladochytrium tenue]
RAAIATITAGTVAAAPTLPATALAAVVTWLSLTDTFEAARVSRAWAAAARPRLFASLAVFGGPHRLLHDGTGSEAVQDLQLVLRDWLGTANRFTRWVTIVALDIARPLLAFVREFEISCVSPNTAADFLSALASAGARPRRLILCRVEMTPHLIKALEPVAASVTHLKYRDLTGGDFSELFLGRLISLQHDFKNCSVAKSLLMSNRTSLQRLFIEGSDPDAARALEDYLATRPSLREADVNITSADKLDILEKLRFPNLRSLAFGGWDQPFQLRASGPFGTRDPLPPITSLQLLNYSKGYLMILARAASSIESLNLGIAFTTNPIDDIVLALAIIVRSSIIPVPVARFEHLIKGVISGASLKKLVACCPNLETLYLRTPIDDLEPLQALVRLRYLSLSTVLCLRPRLIEEAADLVLRPCVSIDGGDTSTILRHRPVAAGGSSTPRVLRVFLSDEWSETFAACTDPNVNSEEAYDAMRPTILRTAAAALERAGERLQIVPLSQLPSYF